MSQYFDPLETRSADQRAADLARDLPALIERAQATAGLGRVLAGVDAHAIT
ncbi:MAG TPA: phenylacetate--CoA ligase family protein, partial [Pararhodobacter sp.]|nr:phenylacetate--CoA ligase family protein [Pararhodobacter sp.]